MTTEIKTHILPMVALKGLTIFPGMVIHFDIGREKSKKALEEAMVKDQKFFVATQKDENIDLPTTEDVYDIGTLVKIKQMLKPSKIGRARVGKECRSRWSPYH